METFKIFGQGIVFSQERLNFFNYYNFFLEIQKDAYKRIGDEWKAAKNISGVYENYGDALAKIAYNVPAKACEYLEAQGVYSSSPEIMMKKSQKGIYIFDDFEEMVLEPYEKIVEQKEGKEEYRKYRKKSRSKYHGYGWDLQSKMTNSAKAAALNTVSGVGHSIRNTAGNIASEIAAAQSQSAIYKDGRIIEVLRDSMVEYVNEIATITQRELELHSAIRIEGISDNERSTADNIAGNIINEKIDKEHAKEYAIQSLQIWPYNEKLYQKLISMYGDVDKSLEKMGQSFGYKIVEYKKLLLDTAYSGILTMQFQKEEEILEKKQEIIDFCDYVGIEDDKYLQVLEQKWLVIDKQIRTVEDEEYQTREEANDVREDIKIFNDLLEQVSLEERDMLKGEEYQAALRIVQNGDYKNKKFIDRIPDRYHKYAEQAIELQKVKESLQNENVLDAIQRMFLEKGFAEVFQNAVRYADYQSEKKKIFETGLRGLPLIYLDMNKSSRLKNILVITTRQIAFLKRSENKILDINRIKNITTHGKKLTILKDDDEILIWCEIHNIAEEKIVEIATFLNKVIRSLQKLNPVELENNAPQYIYKETGISYQEKGWTIVKNLKFNWLGLASIILGLIVLVIPPNPVFVICVAGLSILCACIGLIPKKWNRIIPVVGIVLGIGMLSYRFLTFESEIEKVEDMIVVNQENDLLIEEENVADEDVMNPEEFLEAGEEVEELSDELIIQDHTAEYVGGWLDTNSQRCWMEVSSDDGINYSIDINWADSAWENTHWSFYGAFDEMANGIHYYGSRIEEYYPDDGEMEETYIYSEGEGLIWIGDDSMLHWDDYTEQQGEDCLFERLEY